MLILKRESANWADKVRKYKVVIDGVPAGEICDGETKEYPLSEGMHSLKLKIDWCSSRTVHFEIRGGEAIVATCAPAKKPFLIGELLYITLMCRRYIDLTI